jgi:hypothetical protein
MSLNYLWDTSVGWALIIPQMFHSIYLDIEQSREIMKITSRMFMIGSRIKNLFNSWNNIAAETFTFDFIDYLSIPFMKEIYDRNLNKDKSFPDLRRDFIKNVEVLDQFAQTIFLLAVEDTMPDKLSLFKEPFRVNAMAISLDPDKWEKDGLFNQPEEGMDITSMIKQVKSIFRFKTVNNLIPVGEQKFKVPIVTFYDWH